MAGARRPAIGVLAGALLAAALGSAPPPARGAGAADPFVLPGRTSAAHVVDLDGDGSRELVRMATADERSPLVLEAWGHDGERWRLIDSRVLEIPGEGGVATQRRAGFPVAFLPWHEGGTERVLLIAGEPSSSFGGVEQLHVTLVTLAGSNLRLRHLPSDDGRAERVEVADLDDDGTDELVISVGGQGTSPPVTRILRWTGERFDVAARLELDGGAFWLTDPVIGESDGQSGEDVMLALPEGSEGVPDELLLARVTARDGGFETEIASLEDLDLARPSWPVAVAAGWTYLFGDTPTGPQLTRLAWPRDGKPQVEDSTSTASWALLEPLVSGGEVYFVDDPGFGIRGPTGIEAVIRDARLDVVARIAASPAVRRLHGQHEAMSELTPGYVGPFPHTGPVRGGIGGAPAFISAGNLITVRDGRLETRPTASFLGVAPVGLAGPRDEWLVLTRGVVGSRFAYLYGFPPLDAGLSIVPASVALAPETNDGKLEVEYRGASFVEGPDGPWMASADGGFEVAIEGPPGARVGAIMTNRAIAVGDVGSDGRAILRLDPRTRRNDTVEYEASLVMVTPTGHAYGASWTGRVIRDEPSIEVRAETVTMAAESRVSGEASPFATVLVDGGPVNVDPSGRFSIPVDAGLLPRDVLVTAVDPIGQEASARVQVVGVVDYRGWPWVLIVGVVTVALGAAMYLRTPRYRALVAAPAGDGTLEELDGD